MFEAGGISAAATSGSPDSSSRPWGVAASTTPIFDASTINRSRLWPRAPASGEPATAHLQTAPGWTSHSRGACRSPAPQGNGSRQANQQTSRQPRGRFRNRDRDQCEIGVGVLRLERLAAERVKTTVYDPGKHPSERSGMDEIEGSALGVRAGIIARERACECDRPVDDQFVIITGAGQVEDSRACTGESQGASRQGADRPD